MVKQCHKPPMTGNGFLVSPMYKNGDDWGFVIVLPTLLVIQWDVLNIMVI